MKYIVHKRFKSKAICGYVNLPALTECECVDGRIVCNGKIICNERSENAHQYFSQNEDGLGMVRGKLTQSIQRTLSKRDANYQNRWDKVWSDEVCQKYKREDYEDFWLWNHDFYQADIDVLRHIAKLVGAKEDQRTISVGTWNCVAVYDRRSARNGVGVHNWPYCKYLAWPWCMGLLRCTIEHYGANLPTIFFGLDGFICSCNHIR